MSKAILHRADELKAYWSENGEFPADFSHSIQTAAWISAIGNDPGYEEEDIADAMIWESIVVDLELAERAGEAGSWDNGTDVPGERFLSASLIEKFDAMF